MVKFIIRVKWATVQFLLCTFINEGTILLFGLMVILYCTWNSLWMQIANYCVVCNAGRSDTWKYNSLAAVFQKNLSRTIELTLLSAGSPHRQSVLHVWQDPEQFVLPQTHQDSAVRCIWLETWLQQPADFGLRLFWACLPLVWSGPYTHSHQPCNKWRGLRQWEFSPEDNVTIHRVQILWYRVPK
jgi:hypothetical protein